ncbi:hypothetical protein [Helicobacter sp. T3_23-1059]
MRGEEIIACVLFVMFVTTLFTRRKMVIFVLRCAICFAPFCLFIYEDIRDRTRYLLDESAIWVCGYIFSISLIWTLPILLFFLALSWGKAYFGKKFADKEYEG